MAENITRTYTNPLVIDVADPFILEHEGIFYLYGTSAPDGIRVLSSPNLVDWTEEGMALSAKDSWGDKWFWAPELTYRDGVFYMYYSVEERLAVATASHPLGPFVQEERLPICVTTPQIDSHVFQDTDGKYYIYFVRFDEGNHVYGAVLNDDMLTFDESTAVKLLSPTEPWERTMFPVNEGPFVLKHKGLYYLTYSGDHFESPGYGVGFAVSDKPLGPFKKYEHNPIMQSNEAVHGSGHHSFIQVSTSSGKELFIVYHTHRSLSCVHPRVTAIDRAKFTPVDGSYDIITVHGPTTTPQPTPLANIKP